MRTAKRSLFSLLSALLLAVPVSAWTVDDVNKIINTEANETVAYSAISSYGATYTINLATGATLTHTAWIFNPLTGTGTFQLKPTGAYDNPQASMPNLKNFQGTVILDSTLSAIRLRGSGYSTFSSDMTLEIFGNSQLWLNEGVKCKLNLHDMTNAYDGLGLIRFDFANGAILSGDISVSGNVAIASRKDSSTTRNTISAAITGVHSADDTIKDNVAFRGNPKQENTFPTIALTNANNYWNGTTQIDYLTLELSGAGVLPAGAVKFSGIGDHTYEVDPGTLSVNKTGDVTLTNVFSGAGQIMQKGTGTLTLSSSLANFTGTLNAQAGIIDTTQQRLVETTLNTAAGATIKVLAADTSRKVGKVVLTGSGTVAIKGDIGGSFQMDAYDFRDFSGTVNLLLGRTFDTRTDYFGENATVKVNSGASLMFYTTTATTCNGDYKSDFILAGNGHSEQFGAVRFHVSPSGNLNSATNVSLPNMAGNVTLAADTSIFARVADSAGMGMISGNIDGNYALTFYGTNSNGWIGLTGNNSYGATNIKNGTLQIGYTGSINGKSYDGSTGTLGQGTVTIDSGATLDIRRTTPLTMAGSLVNNGTLNLGAGSALTVALGTDTLKGKTTGSGTLNVTYSGGPTNCNVGDFSTFTGKINLNPSASGPHRVMFSGKTIDFGANSTLVIGDKAQLYVAGSTVFANMELGKSTGYVGDVNYEAGFRADSGTSNLYGTLNLTSDEATISTRAANNSAKLYLYADVTGEGGLIKHEDSNSNAGTLYFGTAEKNGKTYGGTVDYEGKTNIGSGTVEVLPGVTMTAHDDVVLGQSTPSTKGAFVLDDGATLKVGADGATTGTVLNFTGTGDVTLNGNVLLDVFSPTEWDMVNFLNDGNINVDDFIITVQNLQNMDDTLVTLVTGLTPDAMENLSVSILTPGFNYIVEDGMIQLGSSSALPEPSTVALLVLGGLGIFWMRWNRKIA